MKSRKLFTLIAVLSFLLAFPSKREAPTAAPAGLRQFTSGGHVLGFSAGGMYAATGSHALHVDFSGTNPIQPQADSPAGADGIAAPLSRVTYPDLWDGITLTYLAGADSIYTTTYTLAPGAKPSDIRLRYNVPLIVNEDGSLGIPFATGTLTESRPVAWQDIDGQRVSVDASFRVSGNEAGFVLGAYDPSHALTIDPSLVWNTFLGGGAVEQGYGIAVDGSGNVYVTGGGSGSWGTPVRAYTGDYDGFVAKLDSSGNLTWNTFLGGSGYDFSSGIAVDGGGNVLVSGSSNTAWGSPVNSHAGDLDAFAAKLDSAGNLLWNTFLGGSGYDSNNGLALDGSGNLYLAGDSFASWGTPVRAYTASYDSFAAKLDSAGNLTWNTFLGGNGQDWGNGIAVDGSGNVYVAGNSGGTWGTPVRAIADFDAFAAKLDSAGGLTWNTFLGAASTDEGKSIVVDGSGNVYVAGYSLNPWGAPVRAYSAGYDGYAVKLNGSGVITWNTFLGAGGDDIGNDITVDGDGNVFVTGYSNTTWGSPLLAYTGSYDVFAAKLDGSGALSRNAFLGGTAIDFGNSITLDGSGLIYITGRSDESWGDPVLPINGTDVFVAKLSFDPPAAFAKTGPANGSFTLPNPTLSWTASAAADSYEYCYDTTNNSSCDASWIPAGSSTSVVISGLGNNLAYYWQVRAVNGVGTSYADGGTWRTFTARNQTFADVPVDHSLWQYIESFYASGITGGCGFSPLIFCPTNNVTRAAMAVFLLRAKHGAGYTPPAASHYFSDLPVAGKEWQEAWVDEVYREGITTGCGTSPLRFCPENPVNRAAMAVFLLRAKYGSGYTPPAASHFFSDMPVAGKEWMEPWIDEVYREGITTGCGTGPLIYCPETAVKRQAMAAFIVRAFNLPLP